MARRKPPLYAIHEDRGAKFTGFGGWEMPVEFDSIRTEHAAVRDAAGIFDVSHMGEIEVSGPDATTLMQRLTTNDVTALDPGDSQYACITTDGGIILDDTVVYRLADAGGEPRYLFIPNAGHDEQMADRWTGYRDDRDLDATVENVSTEWAMFAVQGPDAPGLVADGADGDVLDLSRFEAGTFEVDRVECLIARTGYTGEDGFEVLCPWDSAAGVWAQFDCQPCGLGARDTLRTEMGFLLSGQDFHPDDEPRNPYEAGVGFTVKLDTEFVGRDALEAAKEEGVDQKFTGVKLLDRGVPRGGYTVQGDDGDRIGHLTSGTMSPTLGEAIGLGYLDVDAAEPDATVYVVIRGTEKRAKIVTPPFINK
ncbi:glycine cleavage system aminomethyltransferase GcvT [Haloferacaceae archaeon DSL9]